MIFHSSNCYMLSKRLAYFLSFFLIAMLSSCKKDGNSNNKQIIPISRPEVTISKTSLALSLPGNCQQSFTISNTGPQGTSLDYSIKDDGAVSGYLDFTNGSGTLSSGQSVTITISIKQDSTDSRLIPIDQSMILDVYTPKASNSVKVPVTIGITNSYSAFAKLIGSWSGTWDGTSKDTTQGGPNYLGRAAGTWQINFLKIDTVKGSISGTLTWKGTDNYWTPGDRTSGFLSLVPNPLNVNKTINFDTSNSTIFVDPEYPCSKLKIAIGYNGPQGSLSVADYYGPFMTANFDIDAKTVNNDHKIPVGIVTSEGFITHPYDPVTLEEEPFPSHGFISGVKN